MFSFHSVVFDLSVGDYIEVYSLNDTNDGGSSVISSSGGKFETWFWKKGCGICKEKAAFDGF